jgi:hypothetical protein
MSVPTPDPAPVPKSLGPAYEPPRPPNEGRETTWELPSE